VKIERKWVSAVSLVTHAAECHRVRAAERDIELTVDISGDLPEIFVDSRKIGQVLSNLLDNATKFTSAGGSITLTAVTDLGFLQFSVLNTGCGIDPAAVPHIFERFYQEDSHPDSKRKGLGLGLYICKEIVELHGGRIWVENESGKGCKFVFALPNHEGGRTELHDLSPVVSEINDFTFAGY
jgi:signal transduction histidine kinase